MNSVTEYSFDIPSLTQQLTNNFFSNYFYTNLIQIASLAVTCPSIYM